MATYVLVHGRFCGAWCWERVTPLLEAAGHKAYAPTLTGVGEKAHLATPDVGLDTHIQDVLGLLEDDNLHEVILVGHSGGGMVITGVADKEPERIAHLVYRDALVPRDGEAIADIVPLIIKRARFLVAITETYLRRRRRWPRAGVGLRASPRPSRSR